MTANEFLIEEINRRAEAAKILREPIKINGVEILAGCNGTGITVFRGIEELAEIMMREIKKTIYDCTYDTSKIEEHRYIIVGGIEFYTDRNIDKTITMEM